MKIQSIKLLYFSVLMILINCKSIQKNDLYGTWRLTGEIKSNNVYATRSSLKEEKVNIKKELTLNKDSTFISNLSLCNQLSPNDTITKGFYHFKQNNNPDKIFWIECNGVHSDYYFILKNKKLELYYPSFTGYKIQIFEK